ncbi:MAG: hypothetical protein AABY22_24145 [Nanoarchaeota archaeon]
MSEYKYIEIKYIETPQNSGEEVVGRINVSEQEEWEIIHLMHCLSESINTEKFKIKRVYYDRKAIEFDYFKSGIL